MIISATDTWSAESIELFLLGMHDVSDAYVGWLNDPEVNRFLESRFVAHTLESTRQFVEGCIASDKTLLLGIRCRWLDNRHVGNIKLEINAHHGVGEVGILIGEKRVHGKGIATQAIRTMAAIAREQLGVRKLSAGCYASNKGSQRAFVKAGFSVEGVRPGQYVLEGRAEDLTLMGCLL